jgi:hypothetical protein
MIHNGKEVEIRDCRFPWDTLQVLSNGDVRVCCWITGPVGNLKDTTIEEIWNGPAIRELRESILRNETHPLCRHAPCIYVQQAKRRAEKPAA